MIQQQPQIARIGDYVIESQIGSGGMGMIYKAKQISMRRIVAIKVLRDNLTSNKKYLDRFFREVRLLASMEHPNMVRVYEGGNDRGNVWFSMEYVQGDDLNLYLMRRQFRFSEYQARFIALHVASALVYAWNYQRIIHRDVKPANIMLTKTGEIKLLDLGISKKLDDDSLSVGNTTADGLLVGSPTYMSPEQVSAGKNIDFRTDIYSLGVTLFHILAGKPPYDGTSVVDVITQHFSAPIPDIREIRPDVSRRVANIIKKMMAKQKEDRYASWEELIAALNKCEEMEQKYAHAKWRRRLQSLPVKWLVLAVVAVCFVAIPAVFLMCRDGGTEKSGTVQEILTQQGDLASAAEPQVTPEQEYQTIRREFLKHFYDRCGKLMLDLEYDKGIKYCTEGLPAEFKEGGALEKHYRNDRKLQETIELYRKKFETLQQSTTKPLR
ncbi:MAG: serine/threonine protein kinase [Lentisphaeria bacterium]|nr:serine/threonine protein kinase [Lentisphaeria bacterium]